MKRLLCLFVLFAAAPAVAEAQPRLLLGGGFTAPNGQITEVAEAGYHLQVGLEVRLPTLPLSLRGDGTFHRLGSTRAGFAEPEVLVGSGSLIFHLPGIGLQPYFLAGVGSYRTKAGPPDELEITTEPGYHGGFGVALGGLSFGGFAEIRYVQLQAETTARLIPLTLGFRF